MPLEEVELSLPQFSSTVMKMLQLGLHGKRRDGSYRQWHRYDPPPIHSRIEQFRFGFVLWPILGEVFEEERLRQLQEEGAGVEELQEVVRGGLALLVPMRK